MLTRRKTGLSPPVKYFNDRFKTVLLLWIIYVIYSLSFPCFRVCSSLPCGHLKGNGWPLDSCCDVYCDFVTLPVGILGQMWYLVVSIPDSSRLSYSLCDTDDALAFRTFFCCFSVLVIRTALSEWNSKFLSESLCKSRFTAGSRASASVFKHSGPYIDKLKVITLSNDHA